MSSKADIADPIARNEDGELGSQRPRRGEVDLGEAVVKYARKNGYSGVRNLFAHRETGEPGKSGVFSLWRRRGANQATRISDRGYHVFSDGTVEPR